MPSAAVTTRTAVAILIGSTMQCCHGIPQVIAGEIYMRRIIAFVYGVASYGVFFATLLYAIGFLGNVGVPKSIDSGPEGSLASALAIDGLLLALFAIQHSVMARPWFKRAWT